MNRPQTWSDIGFAVEFTGDGSPSLRLLNMPETAYIAESMHHSGGAAAETELIYGKTIHHCFEKVQKPHFLSVGLGLGYVELTVAREALQFNNLEFTLESFELVSELKNYFILWLKGGELSPEITEVYDQILKYILKDSVLNPGALKSLLLQKYNSDQWRLQGPLEDQREFFAKAHGILFDAFSAKTTPVLWTEEFLIKFLNEASCEDCLLSTYASRTTLKNALKIAGFEVVIREGFMGKRNSTLGRKGVIFASIPVGTSSHTQ